MADWLATLVPVLGRALLHFVWQGALIGSSAAIALQALRNASPQARYAVACAAMLACAVVPAAYVLVQLAGGSPAVGAPPVALALPVDASSMPAAGAAAWPLRFGAPFPQQALAWIVAFWAAGACVLSLRMAMGVAWIHRLRATPQGPDQAAWQARLDALARRFGPMRQVALRLVDPLDSPAAAGWWRPVVLLPTALLARMPIELVEALLAHELAHVRRHDYLVNLLQGVVEAMLFYHPVTWWLSRRIRIEREQVADRLAAEAIGSPRRLAEALSRLSEPGHAGTAPPHLAPAARTAHGGHLMSRIQQLVQPGRRATGGRVAFPLLGLAAACIAMYAHAQVVESRSASPSAAVVPRAPAAATAAASSPASAAAPVAVSAPAARPDAAPLPAPAASDGPVLQPRVAAAQVSRIDDRTDEAIALVRDGRDGFSMSGSSDDIPAIEAARARIDGDFLWFRRGGKAYVVDDPATVAGVSEAWREADELGARMRALGDEMEVHGARLEALGAQMEQLASRHRPSPAMEAASARMGELAEEQQRLAGRQVRMAEQMARAGEGEREALESRMQALDSQMDALSEQMDRQGEALETESRRLEAGRAPMEALGERMEEASKPMEALGEQMEALGERQEAHVDLAMRETRKLIDAALQRGLAKPAPVAAGRQ